MPKNTYTFFIFICRSQGPGGETDERGDGDGTGKVCFTVREVNQKWRWFYSKKNGSEMALNLWEEKWTRDGAGSTGENQSQMALVLQIGKSIRYGAGSTARKSIKAGAGSIDG